jgi:hypothetical protein
MLPKPNPSKKLWKKSAARFRSSDRWGPAGPYHLSANVIRCHQTGPFRAGFLMSNQQKDLTNKKM